MTLVPPGAHLCKYYSSSQTQLSQLLFSPGRSPSPATLRRPTRTVARLRAPSHRRSYAPTGSFSPLVPRCIANPSAAVQQVTVFRAHFSFAAAISTHFGFRHCDSAFRGSRPVHSRPPPLKTVIAFFDPLFRVCYIRTGYRASADGFAFAQPKPLSPVPYTQP